MSQSFFIPGPLPGLNEIIDARASGWTVGGKRHDRYGGKKGLKPYWHEAVQAAAIGARIKPMQAAHFAFEWYEPKRRGMSRDPDNITAGQKFVLDGLVGLGLLPDDNRHRVLGLSHSFKWSQDRPGVLVTIRESDDETTGDAPDSPQD